MRIAVCDDEEFVCELLERYIWEYTREFAAPAMEVWVDCFSSGEELLDSLAEGNFYEIYFLDYEMGEKNGGEVGRAIRRRYSSADSLIIYVSGHEEILPRLLDSYIFNFISKPVDQQTFNQILKKALDELSRFGQTFVVKRGKESIHLNMRQIYYLESVERQVKVVTQDQVYMMYGKLNELAKQFRGNAFVRIHKSFLVNLDHVVKFQPHSLEMENGHTLDISRKYADSYQQNLRKYRKERML